MGPASAFQTRPEDGSFDYTFDHLAEQRQAAEGFGSGGVQGPFIPNAAEICAEVFLSPQTTQVQPERLSMNTTQQPVGIVTGASSRIGRSKRNLP
jgi:hypothetical protein